MGSGTQGLDVGGRSSVQGEKMKTVKANEQVGGELVDSLLGCSDSPLEAGARPSTETGDEAAVCPPVHGLSTSVISLGVERVCFSESDPASLPSCP